MKSRLQLLPNAPKELRIVRESEWSTFDHKIWDGFDGLIDGLLMGVMPYPEKVCIGRCRDNPVLFARLVHDNNDETGGAGYGQSRGTFARTLVVESSVYAYSKPNRSDGAPRLVTGDVSFSCDGLLLGDGNYDVFTGVVPKEFLYWVTLHMFPKDWDSYFEDSEGPVLTALTNYVSKEVGDVDNIMDPSVRRHIAKLINRAEVKCRAHQLSRKGRLSKMPRDTGLK